MSIYPVVLSLFLSNIHSNFCEYHFSGALKVSAAIMNNSMENGVLTTALQIIDTDQVNLNQHHIGGIIQLLDMGKTTMGQIYRNLDKSRISYQDESQLKADIMYQHQIYINVLHLVQQSLS